jgi:Zn-dependent peptidase ImmA (M78 family)
MNTNDTVFEVVERYWHHAPVEIQSIIRDLGIFYREEVLYAHDSGYIEPVGDTFRIIVNAEHPETRRRFSAAHELGHYTYHRDLIGDGIGDSVAYRSSNAARYQNKRITPQHESQANRFAATVLMPQELIDQLRYDHQLALPGQLLRLAEMLGVSEQALRIRLGYA